MIYILRHGETALNSLNVLQGRSDHPLNETGIRQAEAAARLLRERGVTFDLVFSSPLVRALETARIVAPEAAPVIDGRLIEMDYGPYEGAGLASLPPEVLTFFRDFIHNPAPAGMEPLSAVVARAGDFIEDIRRLDGNILLSTHAIAMKGLLEYLTPDSRGGYWAKYVKNCAIYTAENADGVITVPSELVYDY